MAKDLFTKLSFFAIYKENLINSYSIEINCFIIKNEIKFWAKSQAKKLDRDRQS